MFRVPKPYSASLIVALFLLLGVTACVHSFHILFISKIPHLYYAPYWALLAFGVALTALTASSLLFRKPAPENGALLLVTILVAVYLSELTLWAYAKYGHWSFEMKNRRETYLAGLQKQGVPVDPREPSEVFRDWRRSGIHVVPMVSPNGYGYLQSVSPRELFPLSGISRSFTYLCNESGINVTYTSDEHGFRNPEKVWQQKPPVDVAILGDSFANGVCVKDGEDLASRIRTKYPSTINLGMDGTGPLVQLAIMREYLPSLRPRVVLWFYFQNDLDDLEKEIRNAHLRQYLDAGYSQDLIHRQNEVDGIHARILEKGFNRPAAPPPTRWDTVRHWLRLKGVRNLAASLLEQLPVHWTRDTGNDARVTEDYTRILGIANKLVTDQGGKLFLVLLPDWRQMNRSAEDPAYRRKDRVLAAAARCGVRVIDVQQVFRKDPSPAKRFFDFPGAHYNRVGYQVAAEYVLRRMEDRPQVGSPRR